MSLLIEIGKLAYLGPRFSGEITLFIFFLFERERESERTSRGAAEEEEEAEQGARCGAPSQVPEIMTQAEGRCLTDWATQVPLEKSLKKKKLFMQAGGGAEGERETSSRLPSWG